MFVEMFVNKKTACKIGKGKPFKNTIHTTQKIKFVVGNWSSSSVYPQTQKYGYTK